MLNNKGDISLIGSDIRLIDSDISLTGDEVALVTPITVSLEADIIVKPTLINITNLLNPVNNSPTD